MEGEFEGGGWRYWRDQGVCGVALDSPGQGEWLPHYSLTRLPYFRTNTVVNRRFALCGRSRIV